MAVLEKAISPYLGIFSPPLYVSYLRKMMQKVFIPHQTQGEEAQGNRLWMYVLVIASYIFAFTAALINIFPTLERLGNGDELTYINNGRLLLEGQLPPIAWGPSVSAFYAILYLPFHHTASWLLEVTWIGHAVLFTFLFIVPILITNRFCRSTSRVTIAVALVISSTALTTLVRNSSDSLYAVCNGLMFWQFLQWSESRKSRHLFVASILCAIGAFARNDGWILFCLTSAGLIFICLTQKTNVPRWHNLIRALSAYFFPIFLFLSMVFLLYAGTGGNILASIGERTYGAFEHAQGVVFGEGQYVDDSMDD